MQSRKILDSSHYNSTSASASPLYQPPVFSSAHASTHAPASVPAKRENDCTQYWNTLTMVGVFLTAVYLVKHLLTT